MQILLQTLSTLLFVTSPFHSILPDVWIENPGPDIWAEYSDLLEKHADIWGGHTGLWVENAGFDICVEYSGLRQEHVGLCVENAGPDI